MVQNPVLRRGVTLDAKGNLYGTTCMVGQVQPYNLNHGTVYKLTVSAAPIKKVCFGVSAPAAMDTIPTRAFSSTGSVFGTTSNGRSHGRGIVYEITP